jgi:hypothetical protein
LAVCAAHYCPFERNPAFATAALLVGAWREAVLGSAAAVGSPACDEGGVQIGEIVRMDLRSHLREALRRRFQAVPVYAPIPKVIFEAAIFQVQAPRAELGTIERELQPMVAVLERRYVVPPFREHGR